MKKTSRPIVFSICEWGRDKPREWAANGAPLVSEGAVQSGRAAGPAESVDRPKSTVRWPGRPGIHLLLKLHPDSADVPWPGSSGSPPQADVALSPEGGLTRSVRRGGTMVLEPSALGAVTAHGDFTAHLRLAGITSRRVRESYETATGRRRHHEVDAAETALHLRGAGGSPMDVVVRGRRLPVRPHRAEPLPSPGGRDPLRLRGPLLLPRRMP
ncbi:glycoside hydrolase family 97 N-terminal domain-containing protein [Amycolatopsis minnesotensis]|uniref:glycoside hydrolase family 97 N-terminal domain-containing protein n=1 Tax=Amycolatopsis minnesotensis TaxID=337894 RepID=UPI0031DB6E66